MPEPMTFEQTPFVYQVETLIHVSWFAQAGLQPPYTAQTLEHDLKQEALRIWQKQKYESNNVGRNLTPDNGRRNTLISILERLLRYRKTSDFGDKMDAHY